jgi:hypothetical protein
MAGNKKFYHKIYTSAGVYITTWSTEVTNEPSFRMIINSGLGEMKIRLARPINNYGEDLDVKFNNKIETYIWDKDAPNGVLIYSGYISDYEPVVGNNDEYIEVVVLGYVADLENKTFVDSNGNTAKVYASYDPANIITSILSLFGGSVSAGTIDTVGVSRDYTFNNITFQQAIDKCREFCASGWYWFVGADNLLNFHLKSATATHTFVIGKHFTKLNATKTTRDLKNAVRFIGGTPAGGVQLYKVYEDATSIAAYGRREYVMIDQRVAVTATADAMAQSYLDANKYPFVRATVTILDNNGDDQSEGYNIESIKPGDTCKILDPTISAGAQSYALNQVMIIQSVQYDFDSVTLELSIRPPWVALRIQDLYNDINAVNASNAPTSPAGVGVAIPGINLGNLTFGDPKQPTTLTALWGAVSAYTATGVQTINAGVVTADYVVANIAMGSPIITGGTITGAIVQTAATGRRIVMRSPSQYELGFYYDADLLGSLSADYDIGTDMFGCTLSGGGGTYVSLAGKNNLGNVEIGLTNTYFGLNWYGGDATTERILTNARIDGDWSPFSNGGSNLGSSSYFWNYVYANNINLGGVARSTWPSAGATTLSGLTIDTAKDWGSYGITGLGTIVSYSDGGWNIGSSTNFWNNIYARYLRFDIGYGMIYYDSSIYLDFYSNRIEINKAIKLLVTTTPPASAIDGMMFFHDTYNEVWVYKGGAWKALAYVP